MNNTDMWWDISEPLSYNALINFVVGGRGRGKSYGVKKYATNYFKKRKKQWLYLRRYKDELQKTAPTFFNDISADEDFKDDKLEYKKDGTYYVNGEVAGYTMALSTAGKMKSQSFPNVDIIIFDEFLIDESGGLSRYLPNEVEALLNCIETVFRMRDTGRVFLIANSISNYNPYFLYWNVGKVNEKGFWKRDNLLLLQQVQSSEEWLAAKTSTRFGKLIEGTSYGDYSIHNEVLRDTCNMVKRRPPRPTRCLFTFTCGNERYGVWYDNKESEFFVSDKYDPNMYNYVFSKKEHKYDTILLKSHKPYHVDLFINAFRNGQLFFETEKIENLCKKILLATL